MTLESAVAKVVRCWALDQRVAGTNPGRVIVFAFLGKMINLDCLTPPRCLNEYLRGQANCDRVGKPCACSTAPVVCFPGS